MFYIYDFSKYVMLCPAILHVLRGLWYPLISFNGGQQAARNVQRQRGNNSTMSQEHSAQDKAPHGMTSVVANSTSTVFHWAKINCNWLPKWPSQLLKTTWHFQDRSKSIQWLPMF